VQERVSHPERAWHLLEDDAFSLVILVASNDDQRAFRALVGIHSSCGQASRSSILFLAETNAGLRPVAARKGNGHVRAVVCPTDPTVSINRDPARFPSYAIKLRDGGFYRDRPDLPVPGYAWSSLPARAGRFSRRPRISHPAYPVLRIIAAPRLRRVPNPPRWSSVQASRLTCQRRSCRLGQARPRRRCRASRHVHWPVRERPGRRGRQAPPLSPRQIAGRPSPAIRIVSSRSMSFATLIGCSTPLMYGHPDRRPAWRHPSWPSTSRPRRLN
jgi:hypothetical protein